VIGFKPRCHEKMPKPHPFIPNSDESIFREMLQAVGVNSIDQLFNDIPESIRSKATLDLPSGMSEFRVRKHVEEILAKNKSTRDTVSFLGAGIWPHYIPAAVEAIVSRGEFLTSYTPYQAEISQGMLQVLFEFQTLICELTGMDYANSSLYDWSTALGEAARMAVRVTDRNEIITPHFIHPERLGTLKTFAEPADIRQVEVAQERRSGAIDIADLKTNLTKKTAAVYLEYPAFLGFVEEKCEEIARLAHDAGALFIVGVEPTSLGVLRPPGDFGADVVIGEGQPLGSHMNFGGPLLGIFACRDERLLRQMPGRIIGKTKTQDGRQDAYCMALQTREQHIRRAKATSNICTNEALLSLAASTYLSLLGPDGLADLGSTILDRTHYACRSLSTINGITAPAFDAFHYMEFTVDFNGTHRKVSEINDMLLKFGIQGGLDLSNQFPELGQTALYCVTEVHSHNEIDMLANELRRAAGGQQI
jgi:glycine dehydrogenase subunit 1